MGIKFSQLPITTTVTGSDYIAVLDTTAGVLKRISVSNFGGGGGGVSTFIGTKDEWDDLTEQEKAGYVIVNITDDDPYLIGGHDISGIADGTVSGALIYLNNRVNFKNFIGTVDEWDALTDEEKAVYAASDGATVNFTDDDMPDDIIGDTDISSIGDGTLTGGLASVKSDLADVNSALTPLKEIKNASTTVSTSSTGNADSGVNKSNRIILAAYVSANNIAVEVYASTSSNWYFRITTPATGAVVASQTVTVTYYYIDN